MTEVTRREMMTYATREKENGLIEYLQHTPSMRHDMKARYVDFVQFVAQRFHEDVGHVGRCRDP